MEGHELESRRVHVIISSQGSQIVHSAEEVQVAENKLYYGDNLEVLHGVRIDRAEPFSERE